MAYAETTAVPVERSRAEIEKLLIWCAGMFEAEGTVTIIGGGKRPYTRLVAVLTNTDAEIVRIFQQHWPGGFHCVQRKAHQKTPWVWNVSCRKAAAFLRDIQPYVRTERMKARIELGLLAQSHRHRGNRSRVQEYRDLHEELRAKMRVLNKRGA